MKRPVRTDRAGQSFVIGPQGRIYLGKPGVWSPAGNLANVAKSGLRQLWGPRPGEKYQGFDEIRGTFPGDTDLPWCMVRQEAAGGRQVQLKRLDPMWPRPCLGIPPEGFVVPEVEIPGVVEVRAAGRDRLSLRPIKAGTTLVFAVDTNGEIVDILEVTVKERREVGVLFHYVQHRDAGTKRPVGDMRRFLDRMNGISVPQANVEFAHKGRTLVDLDHKSAPVGKKMDAQEAGEYLQRFRVDSVDLNVFFVRSYVHLGEFLPDANLCVMEDGKMNGTDGQTLAHEAGHFLNDGKDQMLYGGNVHSNNAEDLMVEGWVSAQFGSGDRVRREEANTWNPSGNRTPLILFFPMV